MPTTFLACDEPLFCVEEHEILRRCALHNDVFVDFVNSRNHIIFNIYLERPKIWLQKKKQTGTR